MKRIILFGIGVTAVYIYYSLNNENNKIVAIADNDRNGLKTIKDKHRAFETLDIIEPEKINNMEFDIIIIAVTTEKSIKEIKKQLIVKLGITENKIMTYYEFINSELRFDQRISILNIIKNEIYDRNIIGNVAEVGVYKGEFATYINQAFPDKSFYLFDTFEGFSKKDEMMEIKKIEGEFADTSEGEVLAKMKYPEQCIIRKGYFPDTAEDITEKFCFVSLDADLYEPIYNGLRFFYPLLSKGGYIIIHDFNSPRFYGAKKAVLQFCQEEDIGYVPICDWGMSAVITK